MIRRLLALGLCLGLIAGHIVIFGAPAAGALPVTMAPPAGAGAGVFAQSIWLQARAVQPTVRLGQVALIDVTAVNLGSEPLEYWLPTACASPFAVSVRAEDQARPVPLLREGEPDRQTAACAQVVRRAVLAPGQSVRERFAWSTATEHTEAGTYTIAVRFEPPTEGEGPSVGVSLALRVEHLTDTGGHWAEAAIHEALRSGIVHGYPSGAFLPDRTVSRAEFMKLLVRARGLSPLTAAAHSFTDTGSHWVSVQGYLPAALEAALLRSEDYRGRLNPDEALNRQEAALMVVRALALEQQAQQARSQPMRFSDRQAVSDWAAGYLVTASAAGVILGYPDGSIRPAEPITRAEAVTMVLRMVDALGVWVDQSASVRIGSRNVTGVAVMERTGRALAPLADTAASLDIQVSEAGNGWLALAAGNQTIRVKPAIPYLLKGIERTALDVATPALVEGKVYVPEGVFQALGIPARWDADARVLSLK